MIPKSFALIYKEGLNTGIKLKIEDGPVLLEEGEYNVELVSAVIQTKPEEGQTREFKYKIK